MYGVTGMQVGPSMLSCMINLGYSIKLNFEVTFRACVIQVILITAHKSGYNLAENKNSRDEFIPYAEIYNIAGNHLVSPIYMYNAII